MLDLVVNRLPPQVRAAIERRRGGGRLIALHEIDHPDGYVRAWSGTGTLRFAGADWMGLGDLVAIDGVGGSRKTEVRTVTVTLAGVRAESLALVTKKVRGRLARLSLAALKKNKREVDGEPYVVAIGKCDTQDHVISEDRMAHIVITITQPIAVLDRAPGLAWTPDWLKATYGNDIVGLDDMPNLAPRIESWTPT
jgi:hypothetical protein